MASFSPIFNVYYRIENDRFGAYLHLSNVGMDEAEIVMHTLQDSQKQHWIFVKTTNDTYKILNLASQSSSGQPVYLSVNHKKESIGIASESSAQEWTISDVPDSNDEYRFSYPDATGKAFIYLCLDDGGQFNLLHEDDAVDVNRPTDNLRWRFHEVLPVVPGGILLPKDTYRIRNLSGVMIHMLGSSDVVSTKDQKKGLYHAWEVEPIGNGRCIIKNKAEQSAYLGWRTDGTTKFAAVCKASTPATWELTSFGGGYIYSVGMKYVDEKSTTFKLALSLGDNNEVTLKPAKFAHNQIWLFEPTDGNDAGLPTTDGQSSSQESTDNNTSASTTGGQSSSLEQRYPEIPEGSYFIENCSGSHILVNSGPWRCGPGIRAYDFGIRYKSPTSPQFDIIWIGSFPLAIKGGILALDINITPTTWVLERNASDPSQYYICAAGQTETVITGDTTPDAVSGDRRFLIAPKQRGKKSHLWKFEKK